MAAAVYGEVNEALPPLPYTWGEIGEGGPGPQLPAQGPPPTTTSTLLPAQVTACSHCPTPTPDPLAGLQIKSRLEIISTGIPAHTLLPSKDISSFQTGVVRL